MKSAFNLIIRDRGAKMSHKIEMEKRITDDEARQNFVDICGNKYLSVGYNI